MGNKHEHYELLNMIGYGLAKFGNAFIEEFGYTTKSAFYRYCVEINLAITTSTIKNRMDLFDPYFPSNNRKGWWQKDYSHRKDLIDSLFEDENVIGFSNIVKVALQEQFGIDDFLTSIMPIQKSRYRRLQETGREAEQYFKNQYNTLSIFNGGLLEDARLYGDGYDFQITVSNHVYLAEVKGIRESKGLFRLTEKEYQKAQEFKDDYVITLVKNLDSVPKLIAIENPIKHLAFEERIVSSKERKEYHLTKAIS